MGMPSACLPYAAARWSKKISNRKFTFKEGNWELEGEPIEYKGTEFKYMKFFAYYPYSENVKFDAGKWDAATQTGDPFESYVNTWNIQSDQSGDNYTKQDLMTSSSDAEGERLQGKVSLHDDPPHEPRRTGDAEADL